MSYHQAEAQPSWHPVYLAALAELVRLQDENTRLRADAWAQNITDKVVTPSLHETLKENTVLLARVEGLEALIDRLAEYVKNPFGGAALLADVERVRAGRPVTEGTDTP